jgi:glycosyltransferase involved in cell wall biosynthesis
MNAGRGTLLVISQVYPPDPAAVGQYVADAAEEMVRRGWRVIVYTSARGYDDPKIRYPRRELRGGVEVRRLPLSSFGKRSIAVRLVAQGLFLAQAIACGIWARGLRVVLVSTSPPFAGLGGSLIAWVRRVRLVWWVMDLNPDQMIAAGKIGPGSLPARVFDWINRLTLRRAGAIVALDRFMRDRLLAKTPVPDKVHAIPPWPLDDHGVVGPSRPNGFRAEHRLDDDFLVMYSGNHALQHPLDTLLDAAAILEDEPRLTFLFIGGGTGKAAVEARIAAGARNVLSLPYQPLDRIGESLSAADVHVVTMGDDMVGIVHPCKIYGAMAVGRPILFIGPQDSHAGEIVATGRCGHSIRHGDAPGTAAAIRSLMQSEAATRESLGRNASDTVAERFSRAVLIGRFCGLVDPPSAARPSEID